MLITTSFVRGHIVSGICLFSVEMNLLSEIDLQVDLNELVLY